MKHIKRLGATFIPQIPHFFTLLNALFGFLAIIKATEGDVVTASYCIIIAAFFDAIDGRIARALKCSSAFGCELDSLADALSFCSAPMVIMYQALHSFFPLGLFPLLCWYMCAGLWRLARFNTLTSSSPEFCGLPTTSAALTLAALTVYKPWFLQYFTSNNHNYVLVSMVFILGILMVSSIAFKKLSICCFKNRFQKMIACTLVGMSIILHYYGLPSFLIPITWYFFTALICALRTEYKKII